MPDAWWKRCGAWGIASRPNSERQSARVAWRFFSLLILLSVGLVAGFFWANTHPQADRWVALLMGSLLAAGFFMVRGGPAEQDKAQRMANALAWRIGLSVALFVCLILAYAMGWIKPTGIPMGA